MPPESYRTKYAAGTVWYGEESLFGPDTSFAQAGLNEYGRKCGKLMFVWIPPTRISTYGHRLEISADYGRIEVKCRRCKTADYVLLDVDSRKRKGWTGAEKTRGTFVSR